MDDLRIFSDVKTQVYYKSFEDLVAEDNFKNECEKIINSFAVALVLHQNLGNEDSFNQAKIDFINKIESIREITDIERDVKLEIISKIICGPLTDIVNYFEIKTCIKRKRECEEQKELCEMIFEKNFVDSSRNENFDKKRKVEDNEIQSIEFKKQWYLEHQSDAWELLKNKYNFQFLENGGATIFYLQKVEMQFEKVVRDNSNVAKGNIKPKVLF